MPEDVDPLLLVSALLVLTLLILVAVVRTYQDRVSRLREELQDSGEARRRAAQSQSRLSSEWAPVIAAYPFDPRGFRYVGGPFDGFHLQEDRVAFVAFTGEGRPPPDARVRDLVRAGRVEWIEIPLGDAKAQAEAQAKTPPGHDPWSAAPSVTSPQPSPPDGQP